MAKGKIIYLEGVSSSGKTTLSRVLQKRLPEPFFWVAGDMFWDMAPLPGTFDNNLIFKKGDLATINTVKLFSDLGIGVIFDIVPVGKSGIIKFSQTLCESPVLYVGVTCPIKELRRREKERGERSYEFQKGFGIGLSERQLPSMALRDEYDITVDTYATSSEECADEIIKMISCPENFKAFDNFRSQHGL